MSERKSICVNASVKEAVTIICEGNPGGLNVAMQVAAVDPLLLLALDDMNIRGPQIWVAYKDHCGENVMALVDCIRRRDPKMVETVNANSYMPQEQAVVSGASDLR